MEPLWRRALTQNPINKIAENALSQLGIEVGLQSAFVQRIIFTRNITAYEYTYHNRKVTPQELIKAMQQVEESMIGLSNAFALIDHACRAAGPSAVSRNDALTMFQHASLGAIADAVLKTVNPLDNSDDKIADSMPNYAYISWQNKWHDTFALAAQRIAAIRQNFTTADLRSPTRDYQPWFDLAIYYLAEIYEDATGRTPSAYSPGDTERRDEWRPPFIRFVHDLWSIFARYADEQKPSNRRIADALKRGAPITT